MECTIGRGSIGTVARTRHKESQKWYAVKTLQTQRLSKDSIEEMMNEIEIMMGLDHPNIVRPMELFSTRREIYFVIPRFNRVAIHPTHRGGAAAATWSVRGRRVAAAPRPRLLDSVETGRPSSARRSPFSRRRRGRDVG